MRVSANEVKYLKANTARAMLNDILNQLCVKDLPIRGVRKILRKLIQELDELDGLDNFGTEGWRHAFGMDDEYDCD